jgi:signal transduction histidine kinase
VLALIDVDRIKQAMAAVASARDFSAATVETVQEPLLILDTHLRVLSANRAFYQTFRLSPERVEQVMLTDLDAGNWNVGELVASLDEIRTKGMAFEGLEISHDFERIGPRVVRINGRRIVQPGSNTENILLALEDVTERKFIEQRLLQAAKMQAVGQLASGVAHEVNNQAQAILGFSTFVHESLDVQDPRRSDLEQVIKAATRSGEIAQGLLAFSRQKQFHPEVLDVETVVASVETLLCRIMGPNIEVAVSVDAEVGQVEADRALLEESLVNLALNARDAMPEGGRLLVRASSIVVDDDYASHHEAGVRHGPYARIEVIDSGVGMDAATQARLFQPFFTTKPAGQGTGLGLASVYGTVTQCKGVVCVESAPGRGTTFTIDLPQVRGTMHSIPGDAPTEVAPRGSETILVVEDEEMIRSWTRRVLRQLGYTVLEAREGAEALRIIQEEGNLIQLVLSDVLMPGMDGRELGQRMTMVRPGLPLLYMSGFTEEEVARQGWLGPNQPLLAKPFGGAALASKIREMLDTQAAGLSG